ncbi:helix-turn-helix domain-containing protein [Daejeonella sp.]|uniref:helix-turn-helix domain-containing protein n=1 Tax=Daejeonella sp. TaxID=2805397 RepID=UPI0039836AE5
MNPSTKADTVFLDKLRQEVENNLTNEQFGVEELSKNIGMSRSQLHRKLNAVTHQSVSQFIREYRLARGMELLRQGELRAAEVAEHIGFGSATYFNKCFSDYYGFPPGEVKNRPVEVHPPPLREEQNKIQPSLSKRGVVLITVIGAIGIILFITFAYRTFFTNTKNQTTDKSIAILPFKNLSSDHRNEYFSEGVIEAIRTGLSHVNELRIISRTSVEQYRQTNKRARDIAHELGVSALLEGSIQRDGNKVRIEVRLVDGETEALVWATTYNRELKDIFAIQNEIAQQVAAELNAKLSPEEKSKLSKIDTDNPKAYDLYLKAKYQFRTYTNKGAHNSIDLLTEAIRLDSNFSRAYAFLAHSYLGLATIWGAELSAINALEKGKPLIDKAMALDPGLDEGHMFLGFYKVYHDWDFEGAEKEYKLGIVNDHPDALALYIDYLNFISRHKEAVKYADYLNEIDPYYPNSRIVLSYFYSNRLSEAFEFSESRIQTFSNYYTFDSHGFLLLQLKRYDEAITYFNKTIALEGIRYPRMLGWMGAAYAKSGRPEEARKIIRELSQRLLKRDMGSITFFIAAIHSALNDKEEALKWLQAAYDAHDMEMPWLMTEPQFYNLHKEPQFILLAQKMGFK